MTFDDWYVVINHKYKNTDDTEALRLLRACWFTAQIEQREADAKICDGLVGQVIDEVQITDDCVHRVFAGADDCAAAIRSSK